MTLRLHGCRDVTPQEQCRFPRGFEDSSLHFLLSMKVSTVMAMCYRTSKKPEHSRRCNRFHVCMFVAENKSHQIRWCAIYKATAALSPNRNHTPSIAKRCRPNPRPKTVFKVSSCCGKSWLAIAFPSPAAKARRRNPHPLCVGKP